MNKIHVNSLLNEKAEFYNNGHFVQTDPIAIPHMFTEKGDIEISGFLAATIAWGQRVTIINNSHRLIEMMDKAPHAFILGFKESDLAPFTKFVHRTFNGDDCLTFVHNLQRIYHEEGGLEAVMAKAFEDDHMEPGLGWNRFKQFFFAGKHLPRSLKHLPDPLKGSAAKRMNMYLRWMVRDDSKGVDFGIWKALNPSQLYLPLDVHTSRVARKLGILKRKQDDWRAVIELTQYLRKLDPADPVRYDFALFGMGAFEKF